MERRPGEPHRRRRAGARVRGERQRQHVLDARRAAARRPRVHVAGRSAERPAARRPGLRPVEPAVLRRHVDRRALDPDQRQRVRGRRHHAPGFRSPHRLPESGALAALDAAADGSRVDRSRQPRVVCSGPVEGRRDRSRGRRGSARDRAGDDPRGTLPGADEVRHRRPVAHGGSDRIGQALDMAALRRRRLPSPDRVRQRRQPAARPRGSAPA